MHIYILYIGIPFKIPGSLIFNMDSSKRWSRNFI